VVVITSKGAAVIASDRAVAEKLTKVLRQIETDRKNKTIYEWAQLVEEAGLSGLTSANIESMIGKAIPKKGRLIGNRRDRN